MWTIDWEPAHFVDGAGTDGYDGDWCKWRLRRGDTHTFTVLKAPHHVLMSSGGLSERTAEAARTRGRSEVERHLGTARPPRVIELFTGSANRRSRLATERSRRRGASRRNAGHYAPLCAPHVSLGRSGFVPPVAMASSAGPPSLSRRELLDER